MPAKHGLGRGLDVLINDVSSGTPGSESATAERNAEGAQVIPVEDIRNNPSQPRQTFSPETLQDMVQSIQTHGILQPLLVRRAGAEYELIAGERRLRAAKQAGLTTIPAIVKDVSDQDTLVLSLIENLQRDDLNSIEEAEGYKHLAEQFGLTHEQIAQYVGKGRATVTDALRLLELPDSVKQLIIAGSLSAGHAKVLLSITSQEEQILLSKRAVSDGWSIRDLERAVSRRLRTPRKLRTAQIDITASHLQYLLEKLHSHFGSGVRIVPSKSLANGKKIKGRIEIDFYSNDDLTRILELLGISELE